MTSAIAALLASACCLGPLLLIMLGISGACISSLAALAPFQPLFIAVAVIALLVAARRIWRPVTTCEEGVACAKPGLNMAYKVFFVMLVLLLKVAWFFPVIAPFFY